MIAGTIREARSQSRDRVTTLHLFGDSDNGVTAEMREHEEWTGYEEGGYGQLGRHRKLTAVRGPRIPCTANPRADRTRHLVPGTVEPVVQFPKSKTIGE